MREREYGVYAVNLCWIHDSDVLMSTFKCNQNLLIFCKFDIFSRLVKVNYSSFKYLLYKNKLETIGFSVTFIL